jgi:PTH1 family peptidyl-tRNA hydrolase
MTTLGLIAGLGNPGDRYAKTLHNAGFWFVDEVARRFGSEFRYEKRFDADVCRVTIEGADVWLAKPQSFMNESGGPVRGLLDYYRLTVQSLLVAHDEIDLPPGTVRLKQGGGHGGHNGLRDVIQHCGNEFMRLRLGVGHPGHKDQVTGYVLKSAARDVEAAILTNVDQAADVLPMLVGEGLNAAMKKLHTKD